MICLLLTGAAASALPQSSTPGASRKSPNSASVAANGATAQDLPQLFQAGQDALNHGRLDEAERDFQQILKADPQVAGAYANLGVVYMRRKQWSKALDSLH